MSRTMLLVGTRKGCFILESDGDRRDWSVRGPYCEGWPIYHAIHDVDTGTIYAAEKSKPPMRLELHDQRERITGTLRGWARRVAFERIAGPEQ